MDQLSDSQTRRLPTFIGIGAPKTATTFLDRCLKEHPAIFMPVSKEPHYFSDNYFRGVSEYLRFFDGAEGFGCRGEISTSYFHHPDAPQRVKALLPAVKLLLGVRNPVEQVYSLYWQMKRHNFNQTKDNDIGISFGEALDKYPALLLEPARYGTHLGRWLEHFDPARIHVVFFDDVKADPRGVLTQVFDFLGVSVEEGLQNVKSLNEKVLGGVSPRNASIGRFYGAFYVTLAKSVFMPMKRTLGYQRALWIKDKLKVREAFGKLFFRPGYPPMDTVDRARLRLFFEPEIDTLSSLTERDLSAWLDTRSLPGEVGIPRSGTGTR